MLNTSRNPLMLKSLGLYVLVMCAGILAATAAPTVHAADLTVVIHRIKSAEGKVQVALANKPATFPKEILVGQRVPAHAGSVTVVFKDLAPGQYAVTAYHDLNGNDKLDTNAFGMPIEPYGFSRNARGTMGPPKFADAQIEVGTQALSIEMDVK